MTDDQSIFFDRGGLGKPEYAYEKIQDHEFYKLANNFHATREAPMTQKRTPMNAATAIGTLLILAATLSLLPWGFGADRFLWIAAGTGGAGAILLAAGAFAPKEKK